MDGSGQLTRAHFPRLAQATTSQQPRPLFAPSGPSAWLPAVRALASLGVDHVCARVRWLLPSAGSRDLRFQGHSWFMALPRPTPKLRGHRLHGTAAWLLLLPGHRMLRGLGRCAPGVEVMLAGRDHKWNERLCRPVAVMRRFEIQGGALMGASGAGGTEAECTLGVLRAVALTPEASS